MTEKDSKALDSLYQLTIETRNFEITQLVQRNNFFMVFQGVLLAGLLQASGGTPIPVVSFLVCAAGVIISLLQTGMAAGAKFWQERWEYDVELIEKRLLAALPEDGNRTETYELFSKSIDRSEQIVQERLSPRKSTDDHSEQIVQERLSPRKFTDSLTVRRYSVSRIPIYAGLAFSTVWVLLLACTVSSPFGKLIPSFIVGFPK